MRYYVLIFLDLTQLNKKIIRLVSIMSSLRSLNFLLIFFNFFIYRLLCVVYYLFRLLLYENDVRVLRSRCWNAILDDKIMRIWILHKISLTSYYYSRFNLLVILTIFVKLISTFLFRSIMISLTMFFHVLHTSTYVITLIERDSTT